MGSLAVSLPQEHSKSALNIEIDFGEDVLDKLLEQYATWEHDSVAAFGPVPAGLHESYRTITVALPGTERDIFDTQLKIIRPSAPVAETAASLATNTMPKSGRPLIVLFHGGERQSGSLEQLTGPARELAAAHNAVVVLPNYPLPPQPDDIRWPAAPRAAWAVVGWLALYAEHALDADLSAGFLVGGHRTGGALAAVVAGLASAPKGKNADTDAALDVVTGGQPLTPLARPITGVLLNSAGLVPCDIVPPQYAARNKTDLWSKLRSGANGLPPSSHNHRGEEEEDKKDATINPRCYIIAGHLDPLRDDSIVFEKILAARGYETHIHMSPDSVDSIYDEMTIEAMKWLLEK